MIGYRGILALLVVMSAVPFSVNAGDFGAFTKHVAKLNVSRPPDVMLRGKTLAVKSQDGVPFDGQRGLELAIGNALGSEFTVSNGPSDLVLLTTVISYQKIAAGTNTQTETRSVKVGTKTEKNIFTGKLMTVDDFQNRNVSVQYWVGKGNIALQVNVQDASGTLLDLFSPKHEYDHRIELSVGGVTTARENIPSAQELESAMLRSVAAAIQKRYTKMNEPTDVRLAVDSDLRAGNVLAMSGQWKEALEKWNGVQLKKNPGDRLYNIAVAHTALGYAAFDASRNPEDAVESFQQALKGFEEAMTLDPKEKYFRQAAEQSAQIKTNFGRAREQAAVQQREADILMAKAEVEKIRKEASREDSPDEESFRSLVRARFQKQTAAPSPDYLAQLEQSGRRSYKLSESQSKRVVTQERERLERRGEKMEEYRQNFADFISKDKTIRADDRLALKSLASRLDLSTEDAKAVESEFQFRDLTAPSTAKVKNVAKVSPVAKTSAKPSPIKTSLPKLSVVPSASPSTPTGISQN